MSDFLKTIDMFKKKTEKACKFVLKTSVLDLQEAVMHSTPVKTGRLKSNWRVKVGTPEDTSLYAKAVYAVDEIDEDEEDGIF
jgi:hypothetical protein